MRRRLVLKTALIVQLALLVSLFAGSLFWFFRAIDVGFEHERRRLEAPERLAQAEAALVQAGAEALALIPEWPSTLSAAEWQVLDLWLTRRTREALGSRDTIDGGFYLADQDRVLGEYAAGLKKEEASGGEELESQLPRSQIDLVDAYVRQALDRDRPVFAIVEAQTGTIALRAIPVRVNGRKVAAAWTLAHLEAPGSLGLAAKGYRRATALALGALSLAALIAMGLWLTTRRLAREKVAIENQLNRSQRLAALGTLLAGVAHEVRNPLAGIRSTAQLWQRGLPADAESIADLVAEVDRLEHIIARLQEFSRTQNSRREQADLNDIVREASRLAHVPSPPDEIETQLALEASLPPAEIFPPAILQVLRNLTANSIQAMPQGGTLLLSTRYNPAQDRLEVRVADSGPGLSPEAREHLFEPFFTTRAEGTGLGLAIAREIALAHGGELLLCPSSPTRGACFCLSLPASTPGRLANIESTNHGPDLDRGR